jgi:phage terminase small subunit
MTTITARKLSKSKRGPRTSLSLQQQRFVDEFLSNGGHATNAMIAAGYTKHSIRWPGKVRYLPVIDAEIRRRAAKLAIKADVKAATVIAALGAIVNSNVADYLQEDLEGGVQAKPYAALTRQQLAAVSQLELEPVTVTEGTGKAKKTKTVMRMKLKFWDKNAAANTLCRHFGLFNEGDKGGATDRDVIFNRAVSAVDSLIEGVIREGEARLHAGLVQDRPVLSVEVHPSET